MILSYKDECVNMDNVFSFKKYDIGDAISIKFEGVANETYFCYPDVTTRDEAYNKIKLLLINYNWTDLYEL